MPDPRIANQQGQPQPQRQGMQGQPQARAQGQGMQGLIQQAKAEIAQMPRPELEQLAFQLVMQLRQQQGQGQPR